MNDTARTPWFSLSNVADVDSPALLIDEARVHENLDRMLAMVGGNSARLRPHVKTHKLGPIVEAHLERGITKFKCATLAEAEMVADADSKAADGKDVLLAMQPVGPKIARFIELGRRFPNTRFSTLVDNESTARELVRAATSQNTKIDVWLDIDCGMHRTGIPAGPEARQLALQVAEEPRLELCGLHAYDGHIHDTDLEERRQKCDAAMGPVRELRSELDGAGLRGLTWIAGGTPTFPILAEQEDVECSPGTSVLWDAGYSKELPDLEFLHAAALLCRVVSKPGPGKLCLDLGHKALAAEMPPPRVVFPELPRAKFVSHSEEHLVIETPEAADIAVGTPLYGIPMHICPTTALHAEAVVIRDRRAVRRWPIVARARKITI